MLHSYQEAGHRRQIESYCILIKKLAIGAKSNRILMLHSCILKKLAIGHKSGLIRQKAGHCKSFFAFLSEADHRRQIDSMLHSYQKLAIGIKSDSMLHSYQEAGAKSILCCILIKKLAIGAKSILCCILIKKLAIGAKSILCCILIKKLAIGAPKSILYLHSYQEVGHRALNRFYVAFLSRSWPYAKSILLHSYQKLAPNRFYVAFIKKLAIGAKSILCCILIYYAIQIDSVLHSYQEANIRRKSILCCILIKKLAISQIDSMLHSYQKLAIGQIDSMLHSYQKLASSAKSILCCILIYYEEAMAFIRRPKSSMLHSYVALCFVLIRSWP
ncbi:unnamed protein product [Acanthosepion pharaonis]|uniref:Uncharacterized protein n=1 Tax=Acanthosepion pharaonis TaxID=158019 RepID=A0A812CH37_ACAPH|nr:unnamed protein product [Sepia pharaonis]